jgi:energy-converting hydrogenase Eha subunit C
MQWYQIFGWVCVPLGALMAGPGVVKLVARPKNLRIPASLDRSTFSGLLLVCQSLALATGALWAEIVAITLLAAYFLVWVNNVRTQRREKNVT